MNLPDEIYQKIYKNIFPLNDCIVEAKGRMTIPNFGFTNKSNYEYYDHHEVLDCLFREFSDICTTGDIIINKILKAIHNCDWRTLDNLKIKNIIFYEIIIECWNRWVEDGEPDPNPFWAS